MISIFNEILKFFTNESATILITSLSAILSIVIGLLQIDPIFRKNTLNKVIKKRDTYITVTIKNEKGKVIVRGTFLKKDLNKLIKSLDEIKANKAVSKEETSPKANGKASLV